MSQHTGIFSGRTAVLGTMHGKEQVIAPILRRELGISVVVPCEFDSDAFGTFTRDIPRAGSQLDAARAKVRAAMSLLGADLGIASEGSFGPHPDIPFMQSNLELVLLLDTKHDLEVRGHYRTATGHLACTRVSSVNEALAAAAAIGFPGHGVVVRDTERGSSIIKKDIGTVRDLELTVSAMLSHSRHDAIFIEADLRAHRNPTRMQSIAQATEDLAKHAKRRCPACGVVGFAVVDVARGVPCEWCRTPTDSVAALVYGCVKCGNRTVEPVVKAGATVGPGLCSVCNP